MHSNFTTVELSSVYFTSELCGLDINLNLLDVQSCLSCPVQIARAWRHCQAELTLPISLSCPGSHFSPWDSQPLLQQGQPPASHRSAYPCVPKGPTHPRAFSNSRHNVTHPFTSSCIAVNYLHPFFLRTNTIILKRFFSREHFTDMEMWKVRIGIVLLKFYWVYLLQTQKYGRDWR